MARIFEINDKQSQLMEADQPTGSFFREMAHRSAGILLHITSLPGPAYTGDVGRPAKLFADFLHKTRQSVWQMLPVHPTTAGQGWSPYSCSSAMAANPLLINAEWLVSKNLLDARHIEDEDELPGRANFEKASRYKNKILHEAWLKWNSHKDERQLNQFIAFCSKQASWLDDYALYSILKHKFNQSPWYSWPIQFRDRNETALKNLEEEYADAINEIKWTQMIFQLQWQELRSYCNERKIRLMGDMPMYVAHDSADVWSHREFFTLNNDGLMSAMAGVPPDLFNDEGQLWGMPLFKWDIMKKSGYKWWIDRFRRNVELFDTLRLDHFRGFSAFWAVPAGYKNAKDGQWTPGPGVDLFNTVRQNLGNVPIVAEDLGEIDEPVYILRDENHFPGMNVLQFAFNDEMADNIYLPHNHKQHSVVYSGTHDNNTAKGWFKTLTPASKKHLSAYAGKKITEKNVSEVLCRMAYQSVASLAVLPLQDIFALDETHRMNLPASISGNWTWRFGQKSLTPALKERLNRWINLYARGATE